MKIKGDRKSTPEMGKILSYLRGNDYLQNQYLGEVNCEQAYHRGEGENPSTRYPIGRAR